jgi:hypothetical protein
MAFGKVSSEGGLEGQTTNKTFGLSRIKHTIGTYKFKTCPILIEIVYHSTLAVDELED